MEQILQPIKNRMYLKCKYLILFISFSSLVHAQENYFGGSFSIGYVSHGAYKVYDEGENIGLGMNKYFWKTDVNTTSKISMASSYYFSKVRLDANFSYFSGLDLSVDWIDPFSGISGFTRNSDIIAGNFSIIAYQYNRQSNKRFIISPGIGLGIHKIDLFNSNRVISGFSGGFSSFPSEFTYIDMYVNKSSYQLIGAIETSVKVGTRRYLFLNAMYQVGFINMYSRDIEYINSLFQTENFNGRVQYDGNNYNLNFGIRWHFGDTVGYNIIQ